MSFTDDFSEVLEGALMDDPALTAALLKTINAYKARDLRGYEYLTRNQTFANRVIGAVRDADRYHNDPERVA